MTRQEQIYKKAEGDCIAMLESIERGDIIKGSICPQSYRSGFMDGAKWADSHPQWIPVEEELPEKENEFEDYSKLVVVTNGKDFWKGMYNYGGEDWRTFDLWLIDDATHWMPIVPPRKEE